MNNCEDTTLLLYEEIQQQVLDRPTQLLQVWVMLYGERIFADKQSQVYQYAVRDFKMEASQYFDMKYTNKELRDIAYSELNKRLTNLNSETILEYYKSPYFFCKLLTDTILSQNMTKIFHLRLPIFLMELKIQQLKQDQIKELIVYLGISVAEKIFQYYIYCFRQKKPLYCLNIQSCSIDEEVAISFMNTNFNEIQNKKILFKIHANHRFIGDNSKANPREQEWILDSVIQFKIKDHKHIISSDKYMCIQDYHNFEVEVEDYEREELKHTAMIEDGVHSDVNYFFKFMAFFQVNSDDILKLKDDYIMDDFNVETSINMNICEYLNTQGQLEKLKKICYGLLPKLHQLKIEHQYELNFYLSRIASREGQEETCLRYSQEAIRLSRIMKNKYNEAKILNFLGIMYTEFDKLDKAHEILTDVYQRFSKLKQNPKYRDKVEMVRIYNSLGYCLLSKRQFTEAYPLLKVALEQWQLKYGIANVTRAYSMLRMAQCQFCIYEQQDELNRENLDKLEQLVQEGLKIIKPQIDAQQESYSRAMFLLSLLERRSERKDSNTAHYYLESALKLPESNARYNLLKSVIIFSFPEKPNYSYLNCGVNSMIHFILENEEATISKKNKILAKRRRKFKQQIQNQFQDFTALNQVNDLSYNHDQSYFDEEFKPD